MSKQKILLHVCCANCGTACIERLREEGYEPVLFFSNSNIAPEDEYLKRRKDAFSLAERMCLRLYEDIYNHKAWLDFIKGLENEPEKGARCLKCFEYNLKRTSAKALELGIPFFTTTLTVSPHKRSKDIFGIGGSFKGFLEFDFKKKDGFKKSLELSCEYGFYRQSYCGCEFSRR